MGMLTAVDVTRVIGDMRTVQAACGALVAWSREARE